METSVVRNNLMNEHGYTPYCGEDRCMYGCPRSRFDNFKGQFICRCGWMSTFPSEFIERYRQKWNIKSPNT